MWIKCSVSYRCQSRPFEGLADALVSLVFAAGSGQRAASPRRSWGGAVNHAATMEGFSGQDLLSPCWRSAPVSGPVDTPAPTCSVQTRGGTIALCTSMSVGFDRAVGG